ncbi:MAG TPA: hypothetical protein VF515_03585 [Candidatus Binatia bacterium]
MVHTWTTFDATGWDVHFAPSAALAGYAGASFSITNANSLTLDKGSVLNIPATSSSRITIASVGPCTLNGKIQVNERLADAGKVLVQCAGISLGASAAIEASGAGGGQQGPGGAIDLEGGSGDVIAARGAKLTAKGGGEVDIDVLGGTGNCVLGATVNTAGPSGAGLVDIKCGGNITISDKASIIVGNVPFGGGGQFSVSTSSGTVQIGVATIQTDGIGSLVGIEAGGPVTLKKGATITASSKGADGGEVDISSAGDVCDIGGKITADAAADRSAGIGGAGGTISLQCSGVTLEASSTLEAKGASFNDTLNGPDGTGAGGEIGLEGNSGAITAAKWAKINVKGSGSNGGTVRLRTNGDCTLGATVQADASRLGAIGGDGGSVDIACGGNLILTKDANVVAASQKSASAGTVNLTNFGHCSIITDTTCTFDSDCPTSESCNITPVQRCSLSQGTACTQNSNWPQGEICVQMQLDQAVIQNDGVNNDYPTETVVVATRGAAEINGKITSNSNIGPAGGVIRISPVGLTMGPKANVQANVPGNHGGWVVINTVPGDFDLAGPITATAPTAHGIGGTGGHIQVDACALTVEAKGLVSTDGTTGGENDLVGHKNLTVKGKVSGLTGGVNSLVYGQAYSLASTAKVKPSASPVQQRFTDCP